MARKAEVNELSYI